MPSNFPESPQMPTRDKALPAGCVFWFSVIGFVLTCLVLFGSQFLRSVLPEGLDSAWRNLFLISTSTTPSVTVPEFQSVLLTGKPYFLEIADTDATRNQGLSDRLSLPPGTGMRFIFDTPDRYTFWMNKMHFPIDMVFLNNGVIVNIANNVPYPKTSIEEPAVIQPQQAFKEVLELPAGDADKLGLKIGQRIALP